MLLRIIRLPTRRAWPEVELAGGYQLLGHSVSLLVLESDNRLGETVPDTATEPEQERKFL